MCKSKKMVGEGLLVMSFLAFISLATLTIIFGNPFSSPENYIFIGEQDEPLHTVSERFLSFGIDTVEIASGIDNLHLDDEKLINLTKLISPAHLRIGGTWSERLIFDDHNYLANNESTYDKFLPYFIMDGKDWLKIYNFSVDTNARILFSFNVMLRNDWDWNPSNAIRLLQYSNETGITEIDWQLGNEPNSFRHVFNVSISPEQLNKDFISLKGLLNEFFPKSLLVGPDTTRPQPKRPDCVEYIKNFLSQPQNPVDHVTWHQYYVNGRTATLDDFWDPDVLDLLQSQIDTMKLNIEPYLSNRSMWLTETSSAYGGGAPSLSNSFAGSPMWLDKMGVAAKNGIEVVVRQSLLGGNYSMIDKYLNPLPDWWVSVLHKKLVGTKVVDCKTYTSRYQRLYCHCTPLNYPHKTNTTAITIFGVNLEKSLAEIALNGPIFYFHNNHVDEYVITAPLYRRKSKKVLLNGLFMTYDREMPVLNPMKLRNVTKLYMPGYSLGFWVVHNVNISFCDY